ncbi:hypothetical protein AVEN_71363-1 [Araneus ventricosus]|uniref:Uncharacterized protein n=1 Tax=Araneus ventricosus TaxID=182803 RepID=A0A4Y2BHH8_ARAVE|nr:hypothetical protein AVEN_71363-1 [Araneus ventricosus]
MNYYFCQYLIIPVPLPADISLLSDWLLLSPSLIARWRSQSESSQAVRPDIRIRENHLQKVDGRGNNSSKVSLNFGRRGGPKGMPKRRGLHPLSPANVIQVDGNGLSADTESDEWAHGD